MRQVSVLFINMVLPKKGDQSSWALQKAFEIIYENVRRLRGKKTGIKQAENLYLYYSQV